MAGIIVRAQGGRGKHIQVCLCLAQSIFFELPRPVNEVTEFQATTKTPRGSASSRRKDGEMSDKVSP